MATRLSVILPEDMAEHVRARVRSGEYASESEVIVESLRALQDREQSVEEWLRTEVAAAYDEMEADPSQGHSMEDVRGMLAQEHERATARE